MKNLSDFPVSAEIQANQKIYDEYFDPQFALHLVKEVLDPIERTYFRSSFIGFDNPPARNNPARPLIYVSNHSGMAFPWDAIMFLAGFFKRNNHDYTHSVRALSAPMLSGITLMNPFLLKDFWRKAGGIDATFKNFATMMYYQDSNVLIYPEGVPGIGKGFDKKYQLQRFSTSFIRMSLKYRTDIIPFATVNGEYINPYSYHSDAVNKLVNKFGIPFIPVGFMTLLIPFQPWMFYFGFPAKLTYVMGKRIKPYEMIGKPYGKITEEEIRHLSEKVRRQMQEELNEAVQRYGGKPYQLRELFATWRKNIRKFPFFLPCFWPSIFLEFERRYKEGKNTRMRIVSLAGLRVFLKRPILIAFFLPLLGWLPILMYGYQKSKAGGSLKGSSAENQE